ncbi:MAG: TatD family hydrolase [Atribacterota bacterium]
MTFWIDIHAHLDDDAFQFDCGEVIERAQAVGVTTIVSAGISISSSQKVLEIARRYAPVCAALGVHPQEVKGEKIDFSQIENLIVSPGVIAVGEVGLDYYWDRTYEREQEETFVAQIEIAERNDLPLIVHSRAAERRVLKILAERVHHVPVVWHCFSGDWFLLQEILSHGFYLSVNGVMTYPKATTLRKSLAMVPRERIFLETDAPYLPPQGKRGQRNEPAFLPGMARFLAQFWNIDISILQEQLWQNFQEVFGKKWKMSQQELRRSERGYTI